MRPKFVPHDQRFGDFEAAMDRWLNAYFDAEDLILANMKAANAARRQP